MFDMITVGMATVGETPTGGCVGLTARSVAAVHCHLRVAQPSCSLSAVAEPMTVAPWTEQQQAL